MDGSSLWIGMTTDSTATFRQNTIGSLAILRFPIRFLGCRFLAGQVLWILMHASAESRIHPRRQRNTAISEFLAHPIHRLKRFPPAFGLRFFDEAGLPFLILELLRVNAE